MSLSVQETVAEIAEIDVYEVLGYAPLAGKLHVTYLVFAGSATDRMELAKIFDKSGYTEKVKLDIERFCATVIKWDMTDGDKPIPLTVEAIMASKVPMKVLDNIGAAIRLHDAGPN